MPQTPECFLTLLSMREIESALISYLDQDDHFRRCHDPDGRLPVCFSFVVDRDTISVKVYKDT